MPQNARSNRPLKKARIKKGTACAACHTKKRRCNAGKPVCIRCIRNNEPECVYDVAPVQPRTVVLQQKILDLEAQIDILQSALAMGSDRVVSTPQPQPSCLTLPQAAAPLDRDLSRSSRTSRVQLAENLQLELGNTTGGLMGSWWTTNEPPPSGLITGLIGIFKQQEHQHTHDPRPPEFYKSLYNPNPDIGHHPALRNAVFLLGCGYARGVLTQLESVFLRRTTFDLNDSLARADRLMDYIEAYALLAVYHISKGRYFQSVRGTAAILAFAFAGGLHALKPPHWHPVGSPSLLPRASSEDEIRHRIRVWWMLFTMNRFSSTATNVDSDFDDGKIETVWGFPPMPDSSEESQSSTISSLFVRDSKATSVRDDTANMIRSKCAALADRAARTGFVAKSTPESNLDFWNKFEAVDQAIRRVANTLPSIFEEPHYEVDAAHIESGGRKANHITIVPHILVCDAIILLHSKRGLAGNISSRNACLEACRRAMPVVRQIVEQDMATSIFSYLPVTFTRMFRVFGFQHSRLLAKGDSESAQLIMPELEVLSRILLARANDFQLTNVMMDRLRSQFPVLCKELGML
ncbi:hypothetical protein BOTBODRAFT_28326 [Botryobasidium botryosum FD-172 SS1]|uniref:Zn(2)-C6 fungal-type domain-containing protein n=1 Tax=Botryobasidium botryosum (strain FD-172 SS1) TaxID=930990 RepID=A0A067MVY3_BOTB1|nr:hypothetical protein BOTBODRAFT_28326 [Botryobasidium botryosum FD-172 SS1]